jgi:RNA polymerase sigma factor (sigma-70 family)
MLASMSAASKAQAFYRRHYRGVASRARVLLGDGDAAQDAAQEVFLRIITCDTFILDDPRPTPWLYRVTTNLCLNHLRDDRRRRELLTAAERSPLDPDDLEARAILLDILGRFPEEMQEVAVYHYLDEMTHDEIAALMGISRRTVGNRLLAFRKRMVLVAQREIA